MRCKRCGIQLTANNLDNCPNCGPLKLEKRTWFEAIIILSFAFPFSLIYVSVLSIVAYALTGSFAFTLFSFGALLVFFFVLPYFILWFTGFSLGLNGTLDHSRKGGHVHCSVLNSSNAHQIIFFLMVGSGFRVRSLRREFATKFPLGSAGDFQRYEPQSGKLLSLTTDNRPRP